MNLCQDYRDLLPYCEPLVIDGVQVGGLPWGQYAITKDLQLFSYADHKRYEDWVHDHRSPCQAPIVHLPTRVIIAEHGSKKQLRAHCIACLNGDGPVSTDQPVNSYPSGRQYHASRLKIGWRVVLGEIGAADDKYTMFRTVHGRVNLSKLPPADGSKKVPGELYYHYDYPPKKERSPYVDIGDDRVDPVERRYPALPPPKEPVVPHEQNKEEDPEVVARLEDFRKQLEEVGQLPRRSGSMRSLRRRASSVGSAAKQAAKALQAKVGLDIAAQREREEAEAAARREETIEDFLRGGNNHRAESIAESAGIIPVSKTEDMAQGRHADEVTARLNRLVLSAPRELTFMTHRDREMLEERQANESARGTDRKVHDLPPY